MIATRKQRVDRQARILAISLLAVAVGFSPVCHAFATELSGQARIIDGDTLAIGDSKIRLFGIDAPEKRQTCFLNGIEWSCGIVASCYLVSLIGSNFVTCNGGQEDRYGRIVAVCSVNGADLSKSMVHEGWALSYRAYSSKYVPEELNARANNKGMWAGQFVEPWVWRKKHAN